jgi:hypothetical protein
MRKKSKGLKEILMEEGILPKWIEKGHGGHGLFPPGKEADVLQLLPRRLGVDLDPRFQYVVLVQKLQFHPAPAKGAEMDHSSPARAGIWAQYPAKLFKKTFLQYTQSKEATWAALSKKLRCQMPKTM